MTENLIDNKFNITQDLVETLETLIHTNLKSAAKKFAKTYDIDENEIMKTCLPTLMLQNDMIDHNEKMSLFNEITEKSGLEKMKVSQLKFYLQQYNQKQSGKKQELVERLWSYILSHKKITEDDKECYHVVDMSDTDDTPSSTEYLDIYLDKQRPIANVVPKSSGTKFYLDIETNYVSELSEEDNELYYAGYLAEDGLTVDFQQNI